MKAIQAILISLVCAVAALLVLSFARPPQNLYSLKLKDIDGRTLELSAYRGKKLVLITLSGREAESSLQQLAAFAQRYGGSAAVVGVLSLEDGYREAERAAVKKRLKEDHQIGMVLSEGMYTKKASAGQSELMHWLTHKDENGHFDGEVRGAGQKFFVDEAGVLYGVLGPQAPLSHPIFERIMRKPARPMPPAAVPK